METEKVQAELKYITQRLREAEAALATTIQIDDSESEIVEYIHRARTGIWQALDAIEAIQQVVFQAHSKVDKLSSLPWCKGGSLLSAVFPRRGEPRMTWVKYFMEVSCNRTTRLSKCEAERDRLEREDEYFGVRIAGGNRIEVLMGEAKDGRLHPKSHFKGLTDEKSTG